MPIASLLKIDLCENQTPKLPVTTQATYKITHNICIQTIHNNKSCQCLVFSSYQLHIQNSNVTIIFINLAKIMETNGKWKKIKPQLSQTKIMHQIHIKLTFPSNLQLPKGLKKNSTCRIVEQTSKLQVRNSLSINSGAWV